VRQEAEATVDPAQRHTSVARDIKWFAKLHATLPEASVWGEHSFPRSGPERERYARITSLRETDCSGSALSPGSHARRAGRAVGDGSLESDFDSQIQLLLEVPTRTLNSCGRVPCAARHSSSAPFAAGSQSVRRRARFSHASWFPSSHARSKRASASSQLGAMPSPSANMIPRLAQLSVLPA